MSASIFKRLAIHTPHGRPTPANMRYVDDLRTVFNFEKGTFKGHMENLKSISSKDGLEKLLWTSFEENRKSQAGEEVPIYQVRRDRKDEQ